MQTILTLGPPGSGKTTLIHSMLRSGELGTRVAIVCNDDGTQTTTDAQVMAGIADVQAMNSGCFGCRDEQEARRIISAIAESGRYDYLVVEPLGFVAGHEVPALLASCGIKPLVVTLVDVRHFEENLALSEIVPSQLRAATAAVALTKYADDIVDPLDNRLDSVLAYIARFAPGLPIFLIPPGGTLPVGTLVNRRVPCARGCTHHHDHHDHAHHHDHGFLTMSFRLKPDVTYNDVRQVCGQLPIMPVRLKGVVDGRQFHAVHGEWSQGTGHATENFLTFYHTSAIDISLFATISFPTEKTLEGDTKTLVRSAADVSPEATEHLIRTILARLPREAILTAQGLVTNPEDHELLNEVRE
jgi:G3E family GTPase